MNKPNPRRSNSTKRNALRKRVLREEDTCGICFKPVDVKMPHGMPESPEVDEIIPVSKGGDPYDRKNCRLTHRLCNQKRGNGDRDAELAHSEPLRTSRKW
jgi:5-methylcytosine-specific restriction endonuclease McrA